MSEDIFEETFRIYIWPDGTWCYGEDLEEFLMTGFSDDYKTEELGGFWTAEDIEKLVEDTNKGVK